jgi:KaiC/GvpD/RAD55 family RecA-like ATPase
MKANERDELMRLLHPGAAQGGSTPEEHRIRTWEQIPGVGDLKPQRIEWLVDGMVPRGGVTLLAGESGTGKTWLGLLLARGVASGSTYLGRNCQRADVLYLDRENPESLIFERAQMLGLNTPSPNLKLWGGWAAEPPPLIGDIRLLQLAAERRPLVVIDSLIRFHEQDENSATAMATVMNQLRALAYAGATVLVLHHKPKGETSQYRGSSDIRAAVDVAFGARLEPDAGLLKLTCFKNRLAPEFALLLRPELESSRDFVVASAPQTQHDRDASDANRLFDLILASPGLSQSQLLAQSGLPQRRVLDLLKRFENQLWRAEKGSRRAICYFTQGEENMNDKSEWCNTATP